MSMSDKLERLRQTKANQKATLTALGQSPSDDWETYPDLLRAVTGSGSTIESGYSYYNGTELADLPEWDKTAYPNAWIEVTGRYTLYCSANPVTWDGESFVTPSGSTLRCIYDSDSKSWGEVMDGSSAGTTSTAVFWTNHDILDSNNDVHLAASEPEPIFVSANYQTSKEVTPDPAGMRITPDNPYAGMLEVILKGDPNFKPWNIVSGIEAWGVTGTAKVPVSSDFPTDLPVTEEEFDDEVLEIDPEAPLEDKMVLADNEGNITTGYLYTAENSGMMVYNGTVLPDIERVWTDELKETHPFAYLGVNYAGEPCLLLSSSVKSCDTSSGDMTTLSGMHYKLSGSEWIDGAFAKFFGVLWCSADLYLSDGTLFLTATTPTEYKGFTITHYDPTTTEFRAIGWRRVSKHTTGELAGQITKDDFTTQESGGWNYLKNIRSCTREKLYYKGVEVWPNCQFMSNMMAARHTWYKGETDKNTITEIHIVDNYTPTGSETESWAADVFNTGSIMCYIDGTVLTIAGDGSGKIYANPDSSGMFGSSFRSLTDPKAGAFSYADAIDGLDILDTSFVTDMYCMFYGCYSVSELDVSNFDTSSVTDMSGMFFVCSDLISLDVSNFDTSSVTNMSGMFNATGITSIDLSNFDTSSVTDMSNMFGGSEHLTSLDLSNFDTSSVTKINGMFWGCSGLTSLDLSNFDTSSATDMSDMFDDCSGLVSLDLSNFDTASVTKMEDMFNGCKSLTDLNISSFDTGSVRIMQRMFRNCDALTMLDLSHFNTSSAVNMDCMFESCNKLTTIYVGSGWDTSVATTEKMFSYCGASSVTYV